MPSVLVKYIINKSEVSPSKSDFVKSINKMDSTIRKKQSYLQKELVHLIQTLDMRFMKMDCMY